MSAHADGKIFRYDFTAGAHQLLVTHNCPAYALAWGEHIFAGGDSKKMAVYDDRGTVVQQFNHSSEEGERAPAVAMSSPSGQCVVVGSYDRLRVYNLNVRRGFWEEAARKDIINLYTASALCWKPDGSKLAVGSLCGAVELFECCLKRTIHKGKFEFVYVSPSQVIVTALATGLRIIVRSLPSSLLDARYHACVWERVLVIPPPHFLHFPSRFSPSSPALALGPFMSSSPYHGFFPPAPFPLFLHIAFSFHLTAFFRSPSSHHSSLFIRSSSLHSSFLLPPRLPPTTTTTHEQQNNTTTAQAQTKQHEQYEQKHKRKYKQHKLQHNYATIITTT